MNIIPVLIWFCTTDRWGTWCSSLLLREHISPLKIPKQRNSLVEMVLPLLLSPLSWKLLNDIFSSVAWLLSRNLCSSLWRFALSMVPEAPWIQWIGKQQKWEWNFAKSLAMEDHISQKTSTPHFRLQGDHKYFSFGSSMMCGGSRNTPSPVIDRPADIYWTLGGAFSCPDLRLIGTWFHC